MVSEGKFASIETAAVNIQNSKNKPLCLGNFNPFWRTYINNDTHANGSIIYNVTLELVTM